MESLDLGSLAPREFSVTVGDKEYVLREASEGAAVRYRDAIFQSTKFSKGKLSGMVGLAEAEPLLVSLCLFEGGDKPVPLNVIKCWPARIVKAMFEKAKDISDLGEKENPLEVALDKMLRSEDSPVSAEAVLAWAESNRSGKDDDPVETLIDLASDLAGKEEKVKNS